MRWCRPSAPQGGRRVEVEINKGEERQTRVIILTREGGSWRVANIGEGEDAHDRIAGSFGLPSCLDDVECHRQRAVREPVRAIAVIQVHTAGAGVRRELAVGHADAG